MIKFYNLFLAAVVLLLITSMSPAHAEDFMRFADGLSVSEYRSTIKSEEYKRLFDVWAKAFQDANKIDSETLKKCIFVMEITSDLDLYKNEYLTIKTIINKEWLTLIYQTSHLYKNFNLPSWYNPYQKPIKAENGWTFVSSEYAKDLSDWIYKPLAFKSLEEAKQTLMNAVIEKFDIMEKSGTYTSLQDFPYLNFSGRLRGSGCVGGRLNLITREVGVGKRSCVPIR